MKKTVVPGRLHMISRDVSSLINMLRIVAIALVVLLHSVNGVSEGLAEGELYRSIVFTFRHAGAFGVPLFMMISGYLQGAKICRSQKAFVESAKRCFELVFVFVLWNALIYAIAGLMISQGNYVGPFMEHRVEGGFVSVFGFDSEYPIAYQFWFIWDLSVITLCVSAWVCLFSVRLWQSAVYMFVLVSFLWLRDSRLGECAAFYCLSYVLGRLGKAEWLFSASAYKLCAASAFLAVALVSFLACGASGLWCISLYKLIGSSLLIVLSVLVLTGFKFANLAYLASSTFFVFACHEPLLTLVRRISDKKFGPIATVIGSPVVVMLFVFCLYFVTPNRVREKLWFIFIGRPHRKSR